MAQWKLASANPPMAIDVSAGGNGPMSGTLTSGATSYSVTGAWAASGSVPGRNASAFTLAGSSTGAAPTFVAAAGIMIGPGDSPTQVNIMVAESSSADGSLHEFSAMLGGHGWAQMPGSGYALAAGADGSIWGLSPYTVPGTNDLPVQKWNGTTWVPTAGGGVRIAVGIDGLPWLVNSAGTIFHMNAQAQWAQVPGLGTDIACGADGSVWLLGTDSEPGGYGVYRWIGSTWVKQTGGGTRIAVGPDGLPWLVNNAGAILHMTSMDTWVQVPGLATTIAVGQNSDGLPWITTTNQTRNGYGIACWCPGGWIPVEGSLASLAVDHTGTAWGVDVYNKIFRRGAPGT